MAREPGEKGVDVLIASPSWHRDRSEVCAWVVSLDVSERVVQAYTEHLTEDEAQRATRFRRPVDRRRYVVARGVLRELLSSHTAEPPRGVRLTNTHSGKPILLGRQDQVTPHFNLSHAGDWAMFAISPCARVGVDIERIDGFVRALALAARFFSQEESAALWRVAPAERARRFFTVWTSKEAYIKARGEKIANRLRTFTVASHDPCGRRLLIDELDPDAPGRWTLCGLEAPDGYAATLAVETPDCTVRILPWQHSST